MTPRVITCQHCGAPSSFWKRKKFCSPVCRHRAWNSTRRTQAALARELFAHGVLPSPITGLGPPAQSTESKP